jgi:hypothetical protein
VVHVYECMCMCIFSLQKIEGFVLAGQAVVQFARQLSSDREYAIKFYLDPDSFLAEAHLYATFVPSLRSSIPELAGFHGDTETTMDASEMADTVQHALSTRQEQGVTPTWPQCTRDALLSNITYPFILIICASWLQNHLS